MSVSPGTAIRIMTGAPMPEGADAVVRFEETRLEAGEPRAVHGPLGGQVEILAAVKVGDNVRRAGEDVTKGAVVLLAGALIRPQEIGMLAALGRARVRVHRKPRVAILATGDELVGVDEPIAPG